MSRAEFDPRTPAFQEVISYPDYSLSPANIARNTHQVLDFYFNSGIRNLEPAKEYLREETLPFLRSAQLGLLDNLSEINKKGLISPQDLAYVKKRRESYSGTTGSDLDQEAFGFSIVTFSLMPEISEHPLMPLGFSRRGMLRPPATVRQFIEKIDELGSSIALVAESAVDSRQMIEKNKSLWYTYHFFETGSKLPLKFAESPREFEAREKDSVNKMLDGIEINI